jgi:tetratricopeptide (TPR) repeat protein
MQRREVGEAGSPAHTVPVPRTLLTLLLILLIAVLSAPAPGLRADQTDERLNALFERLNATADSDEGEALTHDIWAIWRQIENAAADTLMKTALGSMRLRRYEDALDVLNQVVKIAPGYAEGWNTRATLLYLMGDYAASGADVKRTLALEPRHFGAWSGLGLIYLSVGNHQAALEAFQRSLELNPHLAGPRQNIEIIKKRLQEDRI